MKYFQVHYITDDIDYGNGNGIDSQRWLHKLGRINTSYNIAQNKVTLGTIWPRPS